MCCSCRNHGDSNVGAVLRHPDTEPQIKQRVHEETLLRSIHTGTSGRRPLPKNDACQVRRGSWGHVDVIDSVPYLDCVVVADRVVTVANVEVITC